MARLGPNRTYGQLPGRARGVMLTESDGLFRWAGQKCHLWKPFSRALQTSPRQPSLWSVGDPHRYAELQEWARSRGIRCAFNGGGDPLISWATFKRRGGCYSMMEVPSRLGALHCSATRSRSEVSFNRRRSRPSQDSARDA